ncbi:3-hydroxyacyl-ACP dehydratase FabZ family protein [Thermomonospora umbrina]|uniref:3-hydroxyacyl-[acyl-carrier-protein] dehydratase n=1 Tax=Thermomonospora umbrina TaxID=111806 RepID=A0A3D9SX37_9ACTN|nr:3-hydroxyacyl-ACP dehydratase FabZ family protein [Thermomonospora umbrina]REF00409.1 3-hydroxyacyl-[acyl-carrier-protein] dehydratase [Thermomonospora umbrina]
MTTEVTQRSLGYSELKQWLRHRHPMIYLDRILDHEPGVFLRSLLSVSGNLDPIAGHFPDRAIYPGSHLIQACAQSGIILYQMSTTPLREEEITLIGSVKARFTKIVVPGDRVVFDVRADKINGNVFFFSATATVEDKTVASFRSNLIRTTVDALGRQLW